MPTPHHKHRDLHSHFGLRKLPFTRELRVEDRWHHPMVEEAVEALRATVEKRESGCLVAPAGTGKTMVLRALQHQLPQARFRTHYVKVTDLSKRDFCREICQAVGARPAATLGSLVRRFQEHMLTLVEQSSLRPVIIIDEAHDMRPDVLAILRVLTNFEMDSRLVVSIVLCGQPPLRRLLRRDDMDAVARRIVYYADLKTLSRDETPDYIRHRLHIAGCDHDLLRPEAYEAVFEAAQGNLRATNHLCLRALELCCAADAAHVTADHVIAARATVAP